MSPVMLYFLLLLFMLAINYIFEFFTKKNWGRALGRVYLIACGLLILFFVVSRST